MNLHINSQRNRIKWNQNKNRNEAMLIGYFMACDPEVSTSLDVIRKAVAAGVDILEIGVPSPNPFLDGEVIQRAHRRVLQSNEPITQLLVDFLKRLRQDVDVPIWVMGYEQDLLRKELYLQLARQQLMDGLVLPNSSNDVLKQLGESLKKNGVDVIRFVDSQMNDKELKENMEGATIIYAQLYKGTTGSRLENTGHLKSFHKKISQMTDAIVVAGFGIRNAAITQSVVEAGYDGVVVGTAFVSKMERKEMDSLFQLISEMKRMTGKDGQKIKGVN